MCRASLLKCIIFLISIVTSRERIAANPERSTITAWNYGAFNERPIIGILAQEYFHSDGNFSYIAASYVKFVEGGGARVLPIHLGRQDAYYDGILPKMNGVLFPGGGVSLTDSEYAKVANIIFNFATKANDAGNYFPIWATCLGFDMLATLLLNNTDIRTDCSAENIAMALTFTPGVQISRLFKDLPSDIGQYLLNLPVTANFHKYCITPEDADSGGLTPLINVLSTNQDANNITFISTYEVIKYPFYAVQWHPEKNIYEWTTDDQWNSIPHSPEAVHITQYFANFFISEARKNAQHFDEKQVLNDLIYSINPAYSQKNGSEFTQIYKFKIG